MGEVSIFEDKKSPIFYNTNLLDRLFRKDKIEQFEKLKRQVRVIENEFFELKEELEKRENQLFREQRDEKKESIKGLDSVIEKLKREIDELKTGDK